MVSLICTTTTTTTLQLSFYIVILYTGFSSPTLIFFLLCHYIAIMTQTFYFVWPPLSLLLALSLPCSQPLLFFPTAFLDQRKFTCKLPSSSSSCLGMFFPSPFFFLIFHKLFYVLMLYFLSSFLLWRRYALRWPLTPSDVDTFCCTRLLHYRCPPRTPSSSWRWTSCRGWFWTTHDVWAW